MFKAKRYSPISFPLQPGETAFRDNWVVIRRYHVEGAGPMLVDLSHRPKYDVQDPDLNRVLQTLDLEPPASVGRCAWRRGFLVNRLNPGQASVWHLGDGPADALAAPMVTEVTDGLVLAALIAESVFPILEKVTPLDLQDPLRRPPFAIQGPVLGVPCQIVVIKPEITLLACSRGYGQSMAEALLEAGGEYGLAPAGERAFHRALGPVST
ncbi:MAG: sarcosine oxidase subunit gamma SoxG [Proteobacteria bacterium]|nr:sarcosine oxidase subunit gamma SoxG [Pseudomonadota bacterium]